MLAMNQEECINQARSKRLRQKFLRSVRSFEECLVPQIAVLSRL